ncbi:hypothetical protein N665_0049s0042 [Sinapis alba]|nr:hypothetical protein N665_0049s0042 [Sinapis alba]
MSVDFNPPSLCYQVCHRVHQHLMHANDTNEHANTNAMLDPHNTTDNFTTHNVNTNITTRLINTSSEQWYIPSNSIFSR